MRVLPAAKEHLDALCALEKRCFDKGSSPLSRRAFAYHIKKGTLFWCAFEGDRLAGYILVFTYPKSGRIYSLAVDPAFTKQGIGKALIKTAIDELKHAGKEKISLEVDIDNHTAIGLYHAFGFQQKQRLPAYYSNGQDGIKMLLGLSQPEYNAKKRTI